MSEVLKTMGYPRLLMIVARDEDERKLHAVLNGLRLPICYQIRGQGTATSEWLDICGLSGTTRILTLALMPRQMTRRVMAGLRRVLSMNKRGKGVAVTIPVHGLQSSMIHLLGDLGDRRELGEKREGEEAAVKSNAEYAMVCVAVDNGYSEDVVEAARGAGARGGTVLKGVRRVGEKTSQFMGMAMQEEQDIAIIIIPREKRQDVMTAISTQCGLKTPAHGVVLSVPIDEALGLQ